MNKSEVKKQVIFAMGNDGDGMPFVILGVTEEAWKHMKDGKTHNFDLSKAGLPIKISMFGGKDEKAVMDKINKIMAAANMPYLDQRGEDFDIDKKPSN